MGTPTPGNPAASPVTQGAGMHRVVVTGLGIVSAIGNDLETVTRALRESRSGIRHVAEYQELGIGSQVAGIPDLSQEPVIDRKLRRFMGDAAIYAYHAMAKAIDDGEISRELVQHPRTGLIVGAGVGSPYHHHQAMEIFREKGRERLLPYYVPQVMGSTVSANLTLAYKVGGPSYSITAACASSAHCIGNAAELIRHGVVDRAFAGGAEEVCWTSTLLFDTMGALSTRWNHVPEQASRPFDPGRDGFVIAGGAGILLLESAAAAKARGARVYGEIAGYGASSDGGDMVQPSVEGVTRAMTTALAAANHPCIDYINPHATSTLRGDRVELDAIRAVFGEQMPLISGTKGLTGHSIAAIGAQEAIFCALMLRHGFIPASANLQSLEAGYEDFPLLTTAREHPIRVCLSNSIGFGGTNASLIFRATDL